MNPALFPLSKKDYRNWVMRLPQLWTAYAQALNWSMTYFAHALPICSGDSLSFGCRNLWTILLRKNISGNQKLW